MGESLVIFTEKVGTPVEEAFAVMRPLKKPGMLLLMFSIGVQGLSKFDNVTECVLFMNWYCTTSPTAAVMVSGL